MAPDHGFEPRPPDSESGALPLRQSGKYGDPCGIRTLHCRLERAVTLPVSRRDHASPITWAGLLCCYTKMVLVPVNDNVIYCYPKHCSQYDNVIQCGHSIPPLPLIDRLWCCEAEDLLQIFCCHTCVLSQSCDIHTCCSHINDRDNLHFICFPIPVLDSSAFIQTTKIPPASYETSGLQVLISLFWLRTFRYHI